MKTQRELSVGRDAKQTLWKISAELDRLSSEIRYADKPSDLSYPLTEMRNLIRQTDLFREKWLFWWIQDRSETLKQWPKLWERYL